MTEREWAQSRDPDKMLVFLRGGLNYRKTRLLACAWWRRLWQEAPEDWSGQLVETAERYADGVATEAEWTSARNAIDHLQPGGRPYTRELVVEEGGFRYDADAYNDDLPYFVDVGGHRHLVVPYTVVHNDIRFAVQGVPSPEHFFQTLLHRAFTTGL